MRYKTRYKNILLNLICYSVCLILVKYFLGERNCSPKKLLPNLWRHSYCPKFKKLLSGRRVSQCCETNLIYYIYLLEAFWGLFLQIWTDLLLRWEGLRESCYYPPKASLFYFPFLCTWDSSVSLGHTSHTTGSPSKKQTRKSKETPAEEIMKM